MEEIKALSKLEMKEITGGATSQQTEHTHLTTGWHWILTGETDIESCGDAYADACC